MAGRSLATPGIDPACGVWRNSLRKVELADQIAEDDRAVAGRRLTHYWRPAEQCRASQMKIGWHAA